MNTPRFILYFCGALCAFASATHAQSTTLRFEGLGLADDPFSLIGREPFQLDLTFGNLTRFEDDEIMSIFQSVGSIEFVSESYSRTAELDDILISTTKGDDQLEITVDAFAPLFSLTINKRSFVDGTPEISVDDLIGFFLDGNNQDADFYLFDDETLVDGSNFGTAAGNIASITLVPEPSMSVFWMLPLLLAIHASQHRCRRPLE